MRCRNCSGTGTVHVEGHFISQPVDMTCWICGGHNFANMSREQIKWYLKVHKAFDGIKGKSLRAGECVAPESWLKLKNAVNMACSRLGIPTPKVAFVKATQYGETNVFVNLREEFRVFEKRIEAIPVAVTAKAAA